MNRIAQPPKVIQDAIVRTLGEKATYAVQVSNGRTRVQCPKGAIA